MNRLLYSTLLYLLVPLQFFRLWRKGRDLPAYRQRWAERLALFAPLETTQPRIWLHAVSVGETIAAAPLVKQILAQYPDHRLLITSTTPTGSAQVQKLFGERVEHLYFPYDLPDVVRRFLRKTRPSLLVIMETELWPNCFHHCQTRQIPIIIANARLSPNSFAGYQRFRGFVRSVLANVSAIAAQSRDDAERFIELGALPERVVNCGNIKFDSEIPNEKIAAGKELRQTISSERPVWIAASTHAGEEEIILRAHHSVIGEHPSALLILVPRHPERFEAVAELCAKAQLKTRRHSRGETPQTDTAVYLGDTMGELMLLYAAADVAFVAGSFSTTGGHNPLEPASLALPVLSGPTVHNFAQIYDALSNAGNAMIVEPEALAMAVSELFAKKNERQRRGAAGKVLIENNRGATACLLQLIEHGLSARP